MSNTEGSQDKVSWGGYVALAFAVVFFSGLMKSNEWWGVFDFTTLNGSFGKLVSGVSENAEGVVTAAGSTFRGAGGSGARDGFMFALSLVPTVMFALAMVNILEHYGALKAARRLMTPLLKPLMGIPGNTGLALIASLQSTDAGASMTKSLIDNKDLTAKEADVFTAFQFSAGAMIVNFFSSGAILFTLTDANGELAVPASIGLCFMVMLVFKVVGANFMRLYITLTEGKQKPTDHTDIKGDVAHG